MPVSLAFDVAAIFATQASPIGEFALAPQRLVLRNIGHRRVWLGDRTVLAGHGEPLLPGEVLEHDGVGILYAIAEPNPLAAVLVFGTGVNQRGPTVPALIAWRVEPATLP